MAVKIDVAAKELAHSLIFENLWADLIFHLVCYFIALGLLTMKWFNIMPHLSLFSFWDETIVPVIF